MISLLMNCDLCFMNGNESLVDGLVKLVCYNGNESLINEISNWFFFCDSTRLISQLV